MLKRRGTPVGFRDEDFTLAKLTRPNFREAALSAGLLTQQQLDTAEEKLLTGEGRDTLRSTITDAELADQLIQEGLVTEYQAMQLREGQTKFRLKDYLIVDYIGKGGMGQVFKAVHEIMGREVAIKVLPRERCTPEAIQNFEREIRNQAQLDHPNLVRAYDAGHDGNVYFLVTEYVPGADLRRLVRNSGHLTESHAARVIVQAAFALEYVHRQGLVHRDVKPGNLLVTSSGSTKVSDLGLAGFMETSEIDPRAGKIVGTADYLSPEIIRNPLDVTPTCDIYSLGCTLYYTVTGKVPFPGGKTRQKIRRHLEEAPVNPVRLNPDLSDEYVDVIGDMMEKDPRMRIQTVSEVILRLEPWASTEGPMVSPQPTKSRWLAAPLPTSEDLADTAEIFSVRNQDSISGSQISQTTAPVMLALEDTESSSTSELFVQRFRENRESRTRDVLITLAVAVPLSLIFGACIALMIVSWWR